MTEDRGSRGRARSARAPGIGRGLGLAFAFAGLMAGAAACRTVEPWERAALSTPRMAPEPHGAHAAFLDHVRQSREAATTGDGSSGGGCGCY